MSAFWGIVTVIFLFFGGLFWLILHINHNEVEEELRPDLDVIMHSYVDYLKHGDVEHAKKPLP